MRARSITNLIHLVEQLEVLWAPLPVVMVPMLAPSAQQSTSRLLVAQEALALSAQTMMRPWLLNTMCSSRSILLAMRAICRS